MRPAPCRGKGRGSGRAVEQAKGVGREPWRVATFIVGSELALMLSPPGNSYDAVIDNTAVTEPVRVWLQVQLADGLVAWFDASVNHGTASVQW